MLRIWVVFLCVGFLLSGCGGGGSGDSISTGDSVEVTAPEPTEPEATDEPIVAAANLINMHDGILYRTGFQVDETGLTVTYGVSQPAIAGDNYVSLESTDDLVAGQLVTYSTGGEVFSTKAIDIDEWGIYVDPPLVADLAAGENLTNFYHNFSHPNVEGYSAIGDFALRVLSDYDINHGVHILLGDSWFRNPAIFIRLSGGLPGATLFNKGVGGNTVTGLLNRFDEDVVPYEPDFVWVMSGTNDYFGTRGSEYYLAEMQKLVNRIELIGATALVFDPSVGPLVYGDLPEGELKARSDEYARVIKDLHFEYVIEDSI